jgi:hypothetical protein
MERSVKEVSSPEESSGKSPTRRLKKKGSLRGEQIHEETYSI